MVPRSDERPNTIGLQVAGKYEEYRAEGAIYPGMALKVTDTQTNPAQLPASVLVNSSAGAEIPLRIADVCMLGNPSATTIEGMEIDDAYASGDLVPGFMPLPGDVFLARVAANASFAVDDILKAHSDGTFVAHGGTGRAAVQVMETHDFSADDPAITPLIRVQAL